MVNRVSELDRISSEKDKSGIGGKLQVLCIIVGIVIGFFIFRVFAGGSEDNWIKDSKGVYVPHGHPASVPDNVRKQHDALDCVLKLYLNNKTESGYNSECLGECMDYAVDVVNVPRSVEDDLKENQCASYLNGEVKNFIEIDGKGNVMRVV